ncbi:MAG: fibronectin type III domain-containing protein [Oscillibacter sp.]|nr:fibronectin type III domain-containing protein [Oscillibacter sp.]
MKQIKRAFAMLMCVATVLSLCMTFAVAGNVCQEIKGTGKPDESVTFTVTTNGKWGKNDLKITQTKGKANLYWSDRQPEEYGRYTVTYKNSNGKEKSKKLTGSEVKLDLKPNQTYTVTVTAYSYDYYHVHIGATGGGFMNWKVAPEWKVSAQKNVELCQ